LCSTRHIHQYFPLTHSVSKCTFIVHPPAPLSVTAEFCVRVFRSSFYPRIQCDSDTGCVNGGTVVTFPGSCMLHNFWHVTEAIKPPYSCARINKSHSTSLYSPTILYIRTVRIESCSNRCQASALFPFSREDVGILGRPSLSAGGGGSGSMSTRTPKYVYP